MAGNPGLEPKGFPLRIETTREMPVSIFSKIFGVIYMNLSGRILYSQSTPERMQR